jgi:hypothetical protein
LVLLGTEWTTRRIKMNERIRRVLLQPADGIWLELLLGVPADLEDQGDVDVLISSIPGLQEMIEDGVKEAKKQMQEQGLTKYALVGRHGVPAIYKGLASHKGNLEFLEPEETGVVTAYLPEQNTFAVWFGEEKWITFKDWTEEKFLEQFDAFIVPSEEEQGD